MSRRPNLVFVFPDQFRKQAMGFWSTAEFAGCLRGGGDPVHTPHLDAFARRAKVLTRATATAPVCSPFRAMCFSGRYPARNGVPHNCGHDRPDCRLDRELTTLTDVLAASGYHCGYVGKYHLDFPHAFDPERPDWYPGGWDVYTPPERRHGCTFWRSYGTFDVHKDPHYWNEGGERIDPGRWSPDYEADVAAAYIANRGRERDPDRPFALFVAMNPPHTPNRSLDDCEAEDLAPYRDRDPAELLVRANVDRAEVAERAAEAAYYFAQVTGVDRAFGRILDALARAGLEDDTVVVFTSDHGELLFSHGRRGKNRIYTECFDIPFLLRFPGRVAPGTDDLLLTPVDIMPTLLGLVGLADRAPDDLDGTDRSRCFTDGEASTTRPRSVPFVRNLPGPVDDDRMHRGWVPAARGVKTQRHTLVYEDLDREHPAAPVIFDDDADPYQLAPLAPDAPGVPFAELRDLLAGHCAAMGEGWRPPGTGATGI